MTGGRGTRKPLVGKWKQAWLTTLPYIVKFSLFIFLLLPILQESWSDLRELVGWDEGSSLQESEAPASFTMFHAYDRSFNLRGAAKAPRSDQVVAMGIPSGLFPVQSNLCMGRRFMAALLDHLSMDQPVRSQQVPKVVAIDKYYGEDSCQGRDEKDFTSALDKSVVQAVQHYAVVIGLSTSVFNKDDRKCPPGERTCQVETPSHAFPSGVSGGYVRINQDPLHIPLRWNDLPKHKGFALAVATAADAGVMDRIQTIYRGRRQLSSWSSERSEEHPFGYLPPLVEKIDAREFFCHTLDFERGTSQTVQNGVDSASWSDFIHDRCGDAGKAERADRSAEYRAAFAGKVIVIGSEDEHDTYSVLGERVPGYELQARYVAALLSGAYLREWPLWLQLSLSVALMFLVERTFGIWGARGRFYIRQVPDLLWNRSSHLGQREGKHSAFAFVFLLLGLTALSALVGLWLGWLPPFSLLALTFTLAVLKIYAWLDKVNEDLAEQRSERQELSPS